MPGVAAHRTAEARPAAAAPPELRPLLQLLAAAPPFAARCPRRPGVAASPFVPACRAPMQAFAGVLHSLVAPQLLPLLLVARLRRCARLSGSSDCDTLRQMGPRASVPVAPVRSFYELVARNIRGEDVAFGVFRGKVCGWCRAVGKGLRPCLGELPAQRRQRETCN